MENVVLFEEILLDMLACCYIVSKDQPARDIGGDGHCGLQGYIEIFIDSVCVGVV